MLKQRVITALVLVAILLPALAASATWPFALFALVGVAAAGWEWGRLNQLGSAAALVVGALVVAVCVGIGWLGAGQPPPRWVWWGAFAIWVLGGTRILRAGPGAWPRAPAPARWLLGVLLLSAAWIAMARARELGINFILSVFCLVWAADIAAYFGGRSFGRRKLAPTISPGKSWEGVWSGMLGALALAAFWLWLDGAFAMDGPSLYGRLLARYGAAGLVLVVVFLVAMSVVGDLLESLVKRAAGAKDSSQLLPGHGGVLDRVDALLPVFPIALALITF